LYGILSDISKNEHVIFNEARSRGTINIIKALVYAACLRQQKTKTKEEAEATAI